MTAWSDKRVAHFLGVEEQAIFPDEIEVGSELGFVLVSLRFDILGHCHKVHWPCDDWGVSNSG